MNIQQAKTQVKQTFLAYSARTETGAFRIPLPAQRPVLLMGPPGIGKTAAMAQVARECGAGLVSFALGLLLIAPMKAAGKGLWKLTKAFGRGCKRLIVGKRRNG